MSSEKANLLLDLLSCPYVENARKRSWIKSLYKALQLPAPTKLSLQAFEAASATGHALVDWAAIDLLNSLEKKELKQAY